MKWFKEMFSFKKNRLEKESKKRDYEDINRNVGYMYLILGSQIALVLLIMGLMMFVGAVISTPWWIFAAIFLVGSSICYYLYRKAKRKWEEFKNIIKQISLGDRNYEITIMGGVLTMRIEQAPRHMLEAKPLDSPKALPPVSSEDTVQKGKVGEEPTIS
ncbi:MAG: DUF2207 domain-containing protein [Syntrophobacterales bacterium]|nr:DUF2207 domain-containing protein [Syntrophobacterales bacterium]